MYTVEDYVRIARTLMDTLRQTPEEAVGNSAIPPDYKDAVLESLKKEQFIIRDPGIIEDRDREHEVWLPNVDRNNWYYWPKLRTYLIDKKGWPIETIQSIDDTTDSILGAMEDPSKPIFDTRGLVVGYVQSGKTANYTSLIAKAADTGYRLIIVLTGMHNTLRYQTQVRLDKELVGKLNGKSIGVGIPPSEKEWYTLTKADLKQGDFEPGNTGTSVLGYSKPVLIVTKKNSAVLKRLIDWLSQAPEQTRRELPCLIIDDEADQASVNTGGNRLPLEADWDNEEASNNDSPSTINKLIRQLHDLFSKKAYVAYTATPFANVLIDHKAHDIEAGDDLYPKSFIRALPRPSYGYFGAREIFGTSDDKSLGMNVIREVPITDIPLLVPKRRSEVETFEPKIPTSLKRALKDFILAGATRLARGQGDKPMAMLVHTSYRTLIQKKMAKLLKDEFRLLRDEWRYFREELSKNLRKIWEEDFQPVTRSFDIELMLPFQEIEKHIGTFLEKVTFKELHGDADKEGNNEIDYEKEPDQKIIVIGGNRLSRGLTLEGLLVSYYVRPTPYYDTLMQMGRWFGYREGYVDVTRIYTTKELENWFRALATIEEELHGEIEKYVYEGLNPTQVGVRIRQHPAMLVTSPLKMQGTQMVNISLANQTLQTITFPLDNKEWLKKNMEVTRGFLSALGTPSDNSQQNKPIWSNVKSDIVLEFLTEYNTDPEATRVRAERMVDYIRRQNEYGELTEWVVAVVGRNKFKEQLGKLDMGISNHGEINLINRSKLLNTNSLKSIASSEDQQIGLNDDQIRNAKEIEKQEGLNIASALRYARNPKQGLLLIYPISKYSNSDASDREALFDNPDSAEHIIGIAVVFPHSKNAATVEYLISNRFNGNE